MRFHRVDSSRIAMPVVLSISALLFAMSAGAAFAGGTAERGAAMQPAASSQTDTLASVDPSNQTVVFWHNQSNKQEAGLNALISEFNSTNQWKITVKGEYAGNYDDMYNKMITGIAGGSVPNLVMAYQNQSASYQLANGLVDLNPYLHSTKWGIKDLADFFPGFLDQDVNSQFNNQRLGLPIFRSIDLMYYNVSWLKQLGFNSPPTTWAQFAQMCAAATNSAKGTYGYAITTDASDIFSEIASRGGNIARADGSGYTLDTPEAKAAFTFMQKLYKDGSAKKIAEKYGEQADFANRKVLFTTGTSAGLPYYAQAIAQGAAGTFDWSVAPMPHSTDKPVVNIYGASVSVTRTTPEKELASWLFLRWFAEPKQEAQWVRVSNYFPSRKSAANELTDYFQKDPKYKDAFDILVNSQSVSEPPFSGYQQVRGLMSTAFNAVLDGANVDQTLAKLELDANKVQKQSAP